VERSDIQKYLHDLNNFLNAANLNACLLRRLHAEQLDQESIDRLDQALRDADRLTKAFQNRVYAELPIGPLSAPAASPPERAPSQN
jgi:hypothetical protein